MESTLKKSLLIVSFGLCSTEAQAVFGTLTQLFSKPSVVFAANTAYEMSFFNAVKEGHGALCLTHPFDDNTQSQLNESLCLENVHFCKPNPWLSNPFVQKKEDQIQVIYARGQTTVILPRAQAEQIVEAAKIAAYERLYDARYSVERALFQEKQGYNNRTIIATAVTDATMWTTLFNKTAPWRTAIPGRSYYARTALVYALGAATSLGICMTMKELGQQSAQKAFERSKEVKQDNSANNQNFSLSAEKMAVIDF